MFTFREKIILNELYNFKKCEKISDLAQKCNVTSRTIINDIDNIKSKLRNSKIKLVTKPGVGVWIYVSEENRRKFEKDINISIGPSNPILPEERVIWIIKKLLDADGFVTFDEIAEELYVSKSTVVKDFDKVEMFLDRYGAKLYKKQKHGTKVIADEKTIRIIKADILKNAVSKHGDIIDDELRDVFYGIDLDMIKQILIETEEEFNYLLSDISFKGLLIHLAISLKRIWQGYIIRMNDEDLKVLMAKDEWKIAKVISDKINNSFKIEMGDSEIGYITIHLAGAKLQNDVEAEKFDLNYLNRLDSLLFQNLMAIIQEVSKETRFDFANDKKLFTALFLHMRQAINRAKYNINLKNPFLNEIKREYGYAYIIAVFVCRKLNLIYKINVSDDEMGYVALHFATSIERFKSIKKKKAILICATGMGTSQLLFTKLNKEFPDVDIVDILSSIKAEKIIDKLSADIILSTVPFKTDRIPVVYVSPLLTEGDIKNIKQIISEPQKSDQGTLKHKYVLNKYMDKRCILLNINENRKEDVIKLLSNQLMKYGYVKDGFYGSVLKREEYSSTYIGNYVALPHPYEGFVIKPLIAVAVPKSPIQWGNHIVKIIIMAALDISAKKDFRKIFEDLSDIINDNKTIDRLLKYSNIDEFSEIFGI